MYLNSLLLNNKYRKFEEGRTVGHNVNSLV